MKKKQNKNSNQIYKKNKKNFSLLNKKRQMDDNQDYIKISNFNYLNSEEKYSKEKENENLHFVNITDNYSKKNKNIIYPVDILGTGDKSDEMYFLNSVRLMNNENSDLSDNSEFKIFDKNENNEMNSDNNIISHDYNSYKLLISPSPNYKSINSVNNSLFCPHSVDYLNKDFIYSDNITYQNDLNNEINNDQIKNSLLINNIKDSKIFISEKVEHIKFNVFNFDEFKKRNEKNKFNEPIDFFPIKEIKKIEGIQKLWSGFNRIFDNEKDFDDILKKGKIYKKLLNILNPKKIKNKKDSQEVGEELELQEGDEEIESGEIDEEIELQEIDEELALQEVNEEIELQEEDEKDNILKNISKKIITFIVNGIIESVNEFDEMKNNKLDKIGRSSIYNHSKREFILTLFEQKLFSIISNDTRWPNQKYNFNIIEKIIKEYNENNKYIDLIAHLCLTFREYFNIITFQADIKINNNKFKKNIVDFLIETYRDKKIKLNIKNKKDYIVALLLLFYNYERFFYLKKSRKKN